MDQTQSSPAKNASGGCRILLISFFTQWLHHFGTELELVKQHAEQGDDVHILYCGGAVNACDTNPHGDKAKCYTCRRLRADLLSQLIPTPSLHVLDDYLTPIDFHTARQWQPAKLNARAFKGLAFKEADLGWGVVSSVASLTRDPDCVSAEATSLLHSFGSAAALTFTGVQRFLSATPSFDTAYIFNGRFAAPRAAWRACQAHPVADIRLHERGCDKDHYDILENHLPHSVTDFSKNAERYWRHAETDEDRTSAGKAFFAERRNDAPKGWKSFTTNQNKNTLPEKWCCHSKNLVIFTSSEDEFVSIGDEWQQPYASQQEAIELLSLTCHIRLPGVRITVREHPNAQRSCSRLKMTDTLASKANCTLIPSEDPVDTYALLDASDIVLTFGSTMGVEATFWQKPAITLGPSFGRDLDVTWQADTIDEVVTLLTSSLKPKPNRNALKYGYYLQTRGRKFEFFKPTSLFDGDFGGIRLSSRMHAISLCGQLAQQLSGFPVIQKLLQTDFAVKCFEHTVEFKKRLRAKLR